MQNVKNVVVLVCAVAIALVMYNFWIGQGFFLGMTEPVPDPSGKVSLAATSAAHFFSSTLEIAAWLISTIVSLVIAGVLGAFRAISAEVGKMIGVDPGPATVRRTKRAGTSVASSTSMPRMPKRQFDDLSRMIIKAAVDGNRNLYLMLGNELNGSDFLTKPKPSKKAASEKGGE